MPVTTRRQHECVLMLMLMLMFMLMSISCFEEHFVASCSSFRFEGYIVGRHRAAPSRGAAPVANCLNQSGAMLSLGYQQKILDLYLAADGVVLFTTNSFPFVFGRLLLWESMSCLFECVFLFACIDAPTPPWGCLSTAVPFVNIQSPKNKD